MGYYAGLALHSFGLSELSIKTIACISGGLVGSGIKSGSYLIIKRLEGKIIDAIEIFFEGLSGALEGVSSAFLGCKAALYGKTLFREAL